MGLVLGSMLWNIFCDENMEVEMTGAGELVAFADDALKSKMEVAIRRVDQ